MMTFKECFTNLFELTLRCCGGRLTSWEGVINDCHTALMFQYDSPGRVAVLIKGAYINVHIFTVYLHSSGKVNPEVWLDDARLKVSHSRRNVEYFMLSGTNPVVRVASSDMSEAYIQDSTVEFSTALFDLRVMNCNESAVQALECVEISLLYPAYNKYRKCAFVLYSESIKKYCSGIGLI